MPPLQDLRFRCSPFVELKQLDELTSEQRETFRDLDGDADCYALLVPRPPLTINIKSVARPTAELFCTLRTPARLDPALLADDEWRGDVVDLLLDGMLEVESGDAFVCGADALAVVSPALDERPLRDAAARLSRAALLYAQDLDSADPRRLATALYLYNRIPTSPFWRKRFADRAAVTAHLGIDRGPIRLLLERDWMAVAPEHAGGWLSWSSKESRPRSAEQVTYKIYISPRPERIRDVFEIVVRFLGAFPGTQFKIGQDAAGLLRPDKFVAYFATREQLHEAAAGLRRELAGCEAHGVPFTAGLDDSGLLSWDIDPPENDRILKWLNRQSWRIWIAQHLASAMSMAKAARHAGAVEPWRFAVERVRRHGVDVDTWTPSAALWSTT